MGYLKKKTQAEVKIIEPKPIWFGITDPKRNIKRFMPKRKAQEFVAKTGKPVFRKVKKFESDNEGY